MLGGGRCVALVVMMVRGCTSLSPTNPPVPHMAPVNAAIRARRAAARGFLRAKCAVKGGPEIGVGGGC